MLQCVILCPSQPAQPLLFGAVTRGGGVGMVDAEWTGLPSVAVFDHLNAGAAPVGIRLCAGQLGEAAALIDAMALRPDAVLWVSGWQRAAGALLGGLPPSIALWLEISEPGDFEVLKTSGLRPSALVLKGQEAGGRVGEFPAFLLVQHARKQTTLPFFVQGGIGPATAAACLAGGATGVVLDDAVWLMKETVRPEGMDRVIRNLNGSETAILGERLGLPVRVLLRPGLAAANALRDAEAEFEAKIDHTGWQELCRKSLGWGAATETAWPLGQGIGLAAAMAERHPTIGRLIQAMRNGAETAQSAVGRTIVEHGPFTKETGTRYPIVQGPMTRVSDVPGFAKVVADGGALPMLALALLPADRVRVLMNECAALLAGQPWGVGILGFVPAKLRDEQLAVVREVAPPFAIIAGGLPEQAAKLDAEGIHTFLHVPTAELLKQYIGRGARHFIFEGRECGGHVGPLSSFVLWESMVRVLEDIPASQLAECAILFAGGIQDGLGAAMVEALAAPVTARGVRVGVLMGTAYLFTREAVASGAIQPRFQEEAVRCKATVNLETGPGHASRCARTPFADEFHAARVALRAAGKSKQEVSDALEALTMGRLRVASKGLLREGDKIAKVEEETQYREGMYMIGQAATLREQVCSIADLHAEVCGNRPEMVEPLVESVAEAMHEVAIIGMSTIMPGAEMPERFWQNLLAKKSAIREIPRERWDWRLYYDSDRRKRDRIYSKWGGFLEEVGFDPLSFGIPPSSLKSIEPMQLLALEATRRALADAGCGTPNYDHERTSVIFGASGGMSDLGQQYATRCELPRMAGHVEGGAWDRLPEWTEESFPGLLFNVAAGRVANRFDFGGSNFTVDAACASSLAALDLAVRELRSGRSDLSLAGGVDTLQSVFAFFCFSKTQALSPSGVPRSFDENADGIVISEGVSVLVLKRLADARRDGDRIYAVVRGMGSSSDGRGSSMTAPTSEGQLRAMRRAYRDAGCSPATVRLYEAHGTGTPVGDRVELQSYSTLLREAGAAPGACVVGSLKSLVGHTKSTAGVAGVAKAALSLYHRTLPPHAGVTAPLAPLREADAPVMLLEKALPWVAGKGARRAAVSAFGFGGTNFHAVLEEEPGAGGPSGGQLWPAEAFFFSASDAAGLKQGIETARDAVENGVHPSVIAAQAAALAKSCDPVALAFVASDEADLLKRIEQALAVLKEGTPLPAGIFLRQKARSRRSETIAMLFPGQGSQYPGALREAAVYLPEIREALEMCDRSVGLVDGRLISSWLWEDVRFGVEAGPAAEALAKTDVAQPAIGALSIGCADWLAGIGVRAGMTAGHSFGEFTALHAGGAMERGVYYQLAGLRGRVMAVACAQGGGAMSAVVAAREDVATVLNGCGAVVANHNSERQTVISGALASVEAAEVSLKAAGMTCKRLPVAGAFHSELMREAQEPLAEAIRRAALGAPSAMRVYSNTDASIYPNEGVGERLVGHMLAPVEFVREIRQMHADGARIFIEAGPRQVLTQLVKDILKDCPETVVIGLDGDKGSLKGLLTAAARLWVEGVGIDPTTVVRSRERALDSKAGSLPTIQGNVQQPWLLAGGWIRKKGELAGLTGKLPALQWQPTGQMPPETPQEPNLRETNVMSINHTAESIPALHVAPAPTSAQPSADQPLLAAYASYQETMRQFLQVQETVMRQFLGGGSQALPAPVQPGLPMQTPAPAMTIPFPVAPAPAPVAAPAPIVVAAPAPVVAAPVPQAANGSNGHWDRATLTTELLTLVSDRTGYPPDALGLDLDVEADLGIDSIKRVEIFAALQQQLPPRIGEAVSADAESITRIRTLGGWIEAVLSKS